MKDNFQFFYRFLLWRDKHIKEKHFILIVSFLVGICTAAAAIVLKSIIHFIQHLADRQVLIRMGRITCICFIR